ELKQEIAAIAAESLEDLSVVLNKDERATLHQELYDEVTGLGPLEPLLKDETINDILVNGPQQIFIERAGKLQLSDITFKDERHLLRIIDKIVSAVGRRVDESNPYVDARLQDGSRFNAMVPPVAVDGSLEAAAPRPAALLVAVTEGDFSVDVKSGENARRTLRHRHVVRELREVGRVAPGDPAAQALVVPVDPEWNRRQLRVVAFVQDPVTLEIHGAASWTPGS
ncbi:MAG: ATPase, T2SS/T4P/T4SS family, partial [Acidobacteriota bacterium]